jgi:hypothetical protein
MTERRTGYGATDRSLARYAAPATEVDRQGENLSMNQTIVYALTRQVTLAYTVKPVPETGVREQRAAYTALLQSLGRASSDEISKVLQERDEAAAERAFSPDASED